MKSALSISMKPMEKKESSMLEKMTKKAMPADEASSEEEEAAEAKAYEKFELDEAVATLHKAAEIKQDADLMKAIGPMLERKKKAINSIDDLRAVAKEKAGSDRVEG